MANVKNLGRVVGKSAYELAVDNGYVGTEAEWIAFIEANGKKAAEHEKAAKASAEAAKKSEDNTAASAKAAKASESAAAQSATDANSSKEAAAQSATAASGSAGSAAGSATAAAGSAKTATDAAGSATTSAEQAAQSATTAKSEADRAKGEADRAKTEADKAQNIIDDSKIDLISTLSSKKSCDLFGYHFDQTAPVVANNFIENYPLEVISKIELKQEGTGDPSPENVRNIVPMTELKLIKCGTNLANPTDVSKYSNNINIGRPKISESIVLKAGIKYTFAVTVQAPVLKIINVADNSQIFYAQNVKSISFTPESDVRAYVSAFYPDGLPENVEIAFSTGDKASFEPYKGTDYTAQFGQDVYGGEFNWETGLLKIKWECLKSQDIEFFDFPLENVVALRFKCPGKIKGLDGLLSNMFKKIPGINASLQIGCEIAGHATSENCYISQPDDPAVTDFTSFRTWIAAHPFEIYYQREIPREVSVISQNIIALNGTTTLYSNIGNIDVTGAGKKSKKADDSKTILFENVPVENGFYCLAHIEDFEITANYTTISGNKYFSIERVTYKKMAVNNRGIDITEPIMLANGTHVGGVHGFENTTDVSIYLNGEILDTSVPHLENCKTIDIFVESDLKNTDNIKIANKLIHYHIEGNVLNITVRIDFVAETIVKRAYCGLFCCHDETYVSNWSNITCKLNAPGGYSNCNIAPKTIINIIDGHKISLKGNITCNSYLLSPQPQYSQNKFYNILFDEEKTFGIGESIWSDASILFD